MADIGGIIGAFLTIIIVFLLGYVFLTVFWVLNPALAILFGIVIAVIVIAILVKIFGGLGGD